MLFSSLGFIYLFLPIVVTLNQALHAAGKTTGRKLLLVAASLLFYAWGNPTNLVVLLGSVAANAALARAIHAAHPSPKRARALLALGLCANVGVLCVYKYSSLGLPLGISFFTLQQVMYLVDCYEGMVEPHSPIDHALFVTFFPWVTAGPIVRSREVMSALRSEEVVAYGERIAPALLLFAIGLVKKAALAQTFARWADPVFDGVSTLSVFEGWMGSAAYTLQLYFDFSGYSDMAIAVAAMLGVKVAFNFDNPLHATSVVDFWKRWHISLSRFITTYLYTPLVRLRSRVTLAWALAATFVSMVVAGFWHGASWNFVVFGTLHGAGLVTNQLWKKTKRRVPRWLAIGLTLVFVNVAFVFFRARTMDAAFRVLGAMVDVNDLLYYTGAWSMRTLEKIPLWLVAAAGLVVAVSPKSSNAFFQAFRPSGRTLAATVALAVLGLLFLNTAPVKDFVYLDF